MAYEIPRQVNFAFSHGAYQPIADFAFYPKPRYAFVPPPSVSRSYQAHWQKGLSCQQQSTAAYSTSRPVHTTRTQSSQQAKPLESAAFGLYWGEMAKRETVVSFRHGVSGEKETGISTPWEQTSHPRCHAAAAVGPVDSGNR